MCFCTTWMKAEMKKVVLCILGKRKILTVTKWYNYIRLWTFYCSLTIIISTHHWPVWIYHISLCSWRVGIGRFRHSVFLSVPHGTYYKINSVSMSLCLSALLRLQFLIRFWWNFAQSFGARKQRKSSLGIKIRRLLRPIFAPVMHFQWSEHRSNEARRSIDCGG